MIATSRIPGVADGQAQAHLLRRGEEGRKLGVSTVRDLWRCVEMCGDWPMRQRGRFKDASGFQKQRKEHERNRLDVSVKRSVHVIV